MKPEQDQDDNGLEACAQDILSAIESKDAKALASAIKAAFEVCEASPHEEYSLEQENE